MLAITMSHCLHCPTVCDSCGTGMRGAELGVSEPWSEPTTNVALYFLLCWHAGMHFVVQPGLLD